MAHILIIDDDAALRRALERHLQAAGHRCTSFVDGRELLEKMDGLDAAVDLVLLDISMPEFDGESAFAFLHLAPADAHDGPGEPAMRIQDPPPVLIITGLPADDARLVALRAAPQVKAVLAKPFSLAELDAAMAANMP